MVNLRDIAGERRRRRRRRDTIDSKILHKREKLPGNVEVLNRLFVDCSMSQQHASISGTDLLRQLYVLPL